LDPGRNQLLDTGFAREVRTNGHFAETKVKAKDVNGLSGSKAKATHLSADISVRLPSGRCLSAEIKTGLAPQELLNDLRIVRHYNHARVADRAEFGWVVVLPEAEEARRSSVKTLEKSYAKLRDECDDFFFLRRDITPWLMSCVAVPGRSR
jgi:hypothetical protein